MDEVIEFEPAIQELTEQFDKGYVLFVVHEENAKDIKEYNFTFSAPNTDNAGVDLCAVEDWKGAFGGDPHLLDLGVRAMLVNIETGRPVHYWLLPRSSIYKTGHMMANSVGVIDASYRGVLKAPVIAVKQDAAGFQRGNRYFQIVAPDMGPIHVVRSVKYLSASERGEGGFGSTGN